MLATQRAATNLLMDMLERGIMVNTVVDHLPCIEAEGIADQKVMSIQEVFIIINRHHRRPTITHTIVPSPLGEESQGLRHQVHHLTAPIIHTTTLHTTHPTIHTIVIHHHVVAQHI
jgi:hypothetical protein